MQETTCQPNGLNYLALAMRPPAPGERHRMYVPIGRDRLGKLLRGEIPLKEVLHNSLLVFIQDEKENGETIKTVKTFLQRLEDGDQALEELTRPGAVKAGVKDGEKFLLE